jgi:hypothetical protein
VPRPGDYFDSRLERIAGVCSFIVRRTWWHIEADADVQVTVEAEFARSPFASEGHKKCCDIYDHRAIAHEKNKPVKSFQASYY